MYSNWPRICCQSKNFPKFAQHEFLLVLRRLTSIYVLFAGYHLTMKLEASAGINTCFYCTCDLYNLFHVCNVTTVHRWSRKTRGITDTLEPECTRKLRYCTDVPVTPTSCSSRISTKEKKSEYFYYFHEACTSSSFQTHASFITVQHDLIPVRGMVWTYKHLSIKSIDLS